MSTNTTLIPYEPLKNSFQLSMGAQIERLGSLLVIQFYLNGSVNKIRFPKSNPNPERLDLLWQHTCFEAFLGLKGSPGYWELNSSPSGDWNCYHFDDYRQGQVTEKKMNSIQHEMISSSEKGDHRIHKMIVDLSQILNLDKRTAAIQLGLAVVLEWDDHSKNYWAVRHAGQKPDFHLRESFVLEIS